MRRRRFDNRLTAIAGWAAMALLDGAGMARAAPPVATASVRGNTIISSVELESLGAGNRIDQILIELGRKPVQSSRPGVVPAGWQCTTAAMSTPRTPPAAPPTASSERFTRSASATSTSRSRSTSRPARAGATHNRRTTGSGRSTGQTIELDFRQLGLQISSRGLPR